MKEYCTISIKKVRITWLIQTIMFVLFLKRDKKIKHWTLYATLKGDILKLVLEHTSLLPSNSYICCTGIIAQSKMWVWVNLYFVIH